MKILFGKIICIGLISLLFLHTNYLAFYYTLYTINIDKLSQDYCEKVKPCCQAKCYLSKKMTDENSNGQKEESTVLKLKLSEFQVTEFTSVTYHTKLHSIYFYTGINPSQESFNRIDHPPRA